MRRLELLLVGRPVFEIGPREFRSPALAPSGKRRGRHRARSLLGHWLVRETPLIAALNTAISLGVLALAFLLMGPVGLARAISPDFVSATSLSPARLADTAGAALVALALLLAARSIFAKSSVRRFAGLVLSAALMLVGLWPLAAGLYSGGIPALFKPSLSLADSALATNVDYLIATVVPSLIPALAIAIGALLSLRQIKSAASARAARGRKALAITGLLASTATLAIGAYAHELRNAGIIVIPDGTVVFGERDTTYAPPFASGIPCHITDGFGERRNPFDGSHYEFHPGVDMAVAYGTPVHAMAGGTVVFSGDGGGFGNMVAVKASDGSANPPVIVEGHMEQLFVAKGAIVRAGDVVGLAGSTGRSTGPHLHLQICPEGRTNRFGAFVCGTAQNPYEQWRALSAIARAECTKGPIVPEADLVSFLAPVFATR